MVCRSRMILTGEERRMSSVVIWYGCVDDSGEESCMVVVAKPQ